MTSAGIHYKVGPTDCSPLATLLLLCLSTAVSFISFIFLSIFGVLFPNSWSGGFDMDDSNRTDSPWDGWCDGFFGPNWFLGATVTVVEDSVHVAVSDGGLRGAGLEEHDDTPVFVEVNNGFSERFVGELNAEVGKNLYSSVILTDDSVDETGSVSASECMHCSGTDVLWDNDDFVPFDLVEEPPCLGVLGTSYGVNGLSNNEDVQQPWEGDEEYSRRVYRLMQMRELV